MPGSRSIATSDPPSVDVVRSCAELRRALDGRHRPLGLVPTMGWLHAGHRSLIARARDECGAVAVSIFVNPRQFDDPADLARYPRGEATDLRLCADAGADLAWLPSVDDVYPAGFDTSVTVERLTLPLEGAARPGHFAGVTTVVAVLFGIVRPDRAYFGEKDGQQLRVIERMARDLGMTEVVRCPTVREPDGLALSSRNVHLAADDRAAAPVLHRALLAGRAAWEAGERDATAVRDRVAAVLATERRAAVEYVSCADDVTLVELERIEGPAMLSLAARFGTTRLIDNVRLG